MLTGPLQEYMHNLKHKLEVVDALSRSFALLVALWHAVVPFRFF